MSVVIKCPFCNAERECEYEEGEPRTWDYPGSPDAAFPVGDPCCEEARDKPESLEDLALEAYRDYHQSLDEDAAERQARWDLEDLPR